MIIPSMNYDENYKTIYKRLFTLCSYLKTKESYDWWVTRRVWGFRHQISKAKYLKVSVRIIRKLQENTEEKYLKMSVAHIWKLQENTAALCKNPGNLKCWPWMLSGWALSGDPNMSDWGIWNVLLSHPASGAGCEISGKVESRPDRMAIVRHSDKVEHWPDRIATVRHPGGMSENFCPDGMSDAFRSGLP